MTAMQQQRVEMEALLGDDRGPVDADLEPSDLLLLLATSPARAARAAIRIVPRLLVARGAEAIEQHREHRVSITVRSAAPWDVEDGVVAVFRAVMDGAGEIVVEAPASMIDLIADEGESAAILACYLRRERALARAWNAAAARTRLRAAIADSVM